VKRIIESGKIKIPLLGSGDMFSKLDIMKFITFTGANGVISARGAIHNPALFEDNEEIRTNIENMPKNENLEQIWLENTDIETYTKAVERTAQAQANAILPKKKGGGDSVEFSLNLVRVLEKRYNEQDAIDIWALVQEYLKYSLIGGNHHANTKYCLLYILKTHK
jgi:tRNA-dihydrouridine synthase